MSTLRPKNWADFQHYKDRSPAWIKLHRGILDDYEYSCLPIASKALAPLLWLLASEAKDGEFESDPRRIAHRLRWPEQEVIDGLKPLIDNGFFEVASGVLAACYQHACLEKRRGEDIKRERENNYVQPAAARTRFQDFWTVYPNKKGRKEAEKAWRKRGLDDKCDTMIDHVRMMIESDDDWNRGFVPNGSTYINQDRWEDEPKRQRNGVAPSPKSKTRNAIETLLLGTTDGRHELAEQRNSQGPSQTALPPPRFGSS